MGKGRALLLLLGLGGLLLALPAVTRKRAGNDPVQRDAGERGLPTVAAKSEFPSKSDRRAGLVTDSPSRLIAALESADAAEQQLALETLLPDLMKRDMRAAAALAADLPAWARREQALLMVSDTWGKSDPASAHRWASGLPKDDERRICLAGICRQAARQDPMLGIAHAESFPGGADPELMEQLAAGLLADSKGAAKEDAIAWIKNRKDPQESDRFFAAGVRALAEKSPEEAARIAVDYMISGPLQEEAVISALHQWVLTDREAAAAWVELFPEGPLRERAEGELFGKN